MITIFTGVLVVGVIAYLMTEVRRLNIVNQDLNERLIAKNHTEYQRNTNQLPQTPDIEYEEPKSYWDVPRVRERREKV